nr:MAG TPA: hypothetical protein [Caudoviricetes sp.]DAT69704.1 MAG TPA: hypothetical protein [Caudoviricetes sp.]
MIVFKNSQQLKEFSIILRIIGRQLLLLHIRYQRPLSCNSSLHCCVYKNTLHLCRS